LHAAWNFGDWILGGKGSAGPWNVVIDEAHRGSAQFVLTIAYLAVMGSATFALWIWYRRKLKIQAQS
jgi:hypothetical protein